MAKKEMKNKKQAKMSTEETLREKRVRAGRKGGNAPHDCRGRACNQNNSNNDNC